MMDQVVFWEAMILYNPQYLPILFQVTQHFPADLLFYQNLQARRKELGNFNFLEMFLQGSLITVPTL